MAVLSWDSRTTAAALSGALVVAICGVPVVWLAFEAVANADLMIWTRSAALLARSLILSLLAAALATGLGAAAAGALNRVDRQRGVLIGLLVIPLLIPSYIHALSWSGLLSDSRWLRRAAGPVTDMASWSLSIWVLTVSYYPVAMLVILAALRRWDDRFTWSAWAHGQGPDAVRRLRMQYLRAPALAAFLVIFLLVFGDFAVPDFFQIDTYATRIFVQVSSYLDTSGAMGLVVPVMIVVLVGFGVLARMSARLALMGSYGLPAVERSPREMSRSPWMARVLAGALVLSIVIIPLGSLVRMTGTAHVLPKALSMIKDDAATGYLLALSVAALTVVIALFAAYALQRRLLPGGLWIRLLVCLLFAVPASLLGLWAIRAWNQSSLLGWGYDCGLALLLALSARWLPLGLELLIIAWRQVGSPQEEAALACGVAWLPTLRRILLPQLGPALGVAFLLITVFSFNELTLVTLLAPPGLSTLTLRMFQTVHYGSPSLLAAICLWHVVFLLVPIAALLLVMRRWQTRLSGQ